MGKAVRGLPEGFDLNVGNDAPIRLGDYLDEQSLAAPAALPKNVQLQSPVPTTPKGAMTKSCG